MYAILREEEEAALAAAGEPMRNYLVHHIFPTLTPALLEVAKLRPDDPIDFLVSIAHSNIYILKTPTYRDVRCPPARNGRNDAVFDVNFALNIW